MNTGETQMKIKVKDHPHWAGTAFQVNINGTKFPRERGVWYQPVGETDDEKEAKAIEMAKAEYAGKYLSRAGFIYESEEEYNKIFNKEWA
jgi:hypothetical protein|tara:strand:+ start:292 stop:561 length:270 start_codon:yes stop_codon:yes gene_type:complete